MAVLKSANFDAATSGNATAVSTGASNEFGVGPGMQHTAAQKVGGAASIIYSGTGTSYLDWQWPASMKAFIRLYVRRETVSTAGPMSWAVVNAPPSNICRLLWEANTGSMLVRNGTTLVATYPVTGGQWYRVDWSVEVGVGQRVRLYTGATIHSSNTGDAVAGGALLALTGSNATQILHLGEYIPVTPQVNFHIDEMVIDGTTMPAPYVPAAGRRLEKKVSGVWVPQVLEKKVAGVWTAQIVERKDAGVWS